MQQGLVPDDLHELVFNFFYKFSRFEFALKEAGKFQRGKVGSPALPDWEGFVRDYEGSYRLTAAAAALVKANPKKQVIGKKSLEFTVLTFDEQSTDLAKVSRLARTVRNNLFHGGKHDSEGWDNPERIRELLPLSSTVLDELAALAQMGGDYDGAY